MNKPKKTYLTRLLSLASFAVLPDFTLMLFPSRELHLLYLLLAFVVLASLSFRRHGLIALLNVFQTSVCFSRGRIEEMKAHGKHDERVRWLKSPTTWFWRRAKTQWVLVEYKYFDIESGILQVDPLYLCLIGFFSTIFWRAIFRWIHFIIAPNPLWAYVLDVHLFKAQEICLLLLGVDGSKRCTKWAIRFEAYLR